MTALADTALLSGSPATLDAAEAQPGCGEWRQPSDADFDATIGKDKAAFIDRVLSVLEHEVVPKTMEGVRAGNKLFGAAILTKSDLSTVLTATNAETGNPLMHGEVTAIFDFYWKWLVVDVMLSVGISATLLTHRVARR